MTPPTIHLPISVPNANEASGVKRGKAYKSSLASSLSNMMAQLDRYGEKSVWLLLLIFLLKVEILDKLILVIFLKTPHKETATL